MIHFICGSTGAGKSTYAAELAGRIGGVAFYLDEWMTALFAKDAPQPIDAAWMMERVGRCQQRIWETSRQVAARGTPCILEMGFNQRATRDRFAVLAKEVGLPVQLHLLDVPVEERWRRVEGRNAGGRGHLTFAVTRPMFDFVEQMWELPDEDEMAALNGVQVT